MKAINTILIATLISSSAFGQTKMVITSTSNISIYGTSNVHDWPEHCESQGKSITVNMEENKPHYGCKRGHYSLNGTLLPLP